VIGPLEIVIILVIIGVVFAGYFRKRLPEFGRSAGKTARVGTEKARELASQTGDKAGDKWDSQAIGRKAGEGVREAREIRDSFKGALDSPPAKPSAGSAAEASDDATAAPDEPLPANDPQDPKSD
jgi:Sec-independent protein translocase protein TatA